MTLGNDIIATILFGKSWHTVRLHVICFYGRLSERANVHIHIASGACTVASHRQTYANIRPISCQASLILPYM